MPRNLFFLTTVCSVGDRVALAPSDSRKILTVLRAHSGDEVRIADVGGTVFVARLDLAEKVVYAVIGAPSTSQKAEVGLRVVLAQAIPKGQRMDFIVEKATELGVSAIVPLRSQRVVGERTGEQKRERWQRIAKSAAQQSGRDRIPSVDAEVDWVTLCSTFDDYDRVYILWEGAETVPLRKWFELEAHDLSAVLFIVGPEGGFSVEEIAYAESANAQPVSLGRRTLRADTAALVALTAFLYARSEL